MNCNEIAVILAGFGFGELAKQCGEECARRGMKIQQFALGKGSGKEEVGGVQVEITDFADAQAKDKLAQAVQGAKKSGMVPIVVDVTQVVENANIYNQVGVPFVMKVVGDQDEKRLSGMVNESQNLALIDQEMNKHLAAFDRFFYDWSTAFPGAFSGFSLLGSESQPYSAGNALHALTRSHLSSFGRLLDEDLSDSLITRLRDAGESERAGVPREALMSHYHNDYTFKDGSGSATFEFRQSVDGTRGYASGVADSVQYLAESLKSAVSQGVFSIEDVLRGPVRNRALEEGAKGERDRVGGTTTSSQATNQTSPTRA